MAKNQKRINSNNRKKRIRYRLKSQSNGVPRLSVFISNKHIYAQIIDDEKGVTISSSSTLSAEFKKSGLSSCTVESAALIGKTVAELASKAQVKKVFFDRGSLLYHGRVKALADSARESGLEF